MFIIKAHFSQVTKNPGLWRILFQLFKNYISLTLEKGLKNLHL